MSYIYLMSLGYDSLYKVGLSNNPKRRLRSLQAGNPKLELKQAWEVGKKGLKKQEKACHDLLAKYHVEREIFRLDATGIRMLQNLMASQSLQYENKRKMHQRSGKGKTHITEAGQPCWHCKTPVRQASHPDGWRPPRKQKFYFTKWLHCPSCRAKYFVKGDRRKVKDFYKLTG